MSGTAPEDRERLRDAEHVLHGAGGSGAWQQLLYVVYVLALLSGIYGFTVLRAAVEVFGPRWASDGLVTPIVAGSALLLVAVLVLGHLAGRRRGPVTPDLAWVDHVVASSVDRRLTLREAWSLPFTGLAAGGAVVGGVVGAALFGGGATGPATAVAGLPVGVAYGAALAVLWLGGQVAADAWSAKASTTRAVGLAARPQQALRALGVEGLREHSARSSRLGGAVLAGDPRALRLEAASPVRRGRRLRLRSRGPWRTVVARDVLGLRRQPLLLVGGVVLVAAGALALAWAVSEPSVPVLVVAVGVLGCHLGAGLWAEGVRLLGDTLGAPRLLGGSVRREALAHSVLPLGLFAVVAAVVVGAWAVTDGRPVALVAGALGEVAVLVVATQWVAAFRVLPPELALLPETGPSVLLAWLAWPAVLVTAVGTLVVVRVADLEHGGSPVSAALVAAGALALVGGLAIRALGRAAVAHRD